MTCTKMVTPASHPLVHRDQHQIRERLLFRLGISPNGTAGGSPSITRGTVRSTPKLPCHHDGDCSSSVPVTPDCSGQRRQVRFAPSVKMQEIPSHRDYDQETRQSIWMGTREIERNAHRNRLEYRTDGFDYTKVTEEKGMMRWNGELVHPATYWILYQEEQEQLLFEQEQEDAFGYSMGRMPLKKSTTFSSLAGMAA